MCIDSVKNTDQNDIEVASEIKTDDMENRDELKIRRISGGCMVKYPPLISLDGEIIFVIWDGTVRAFSITTGELIRDLETDGEKENIVGICLDKNSSKLIYGCTSNGIIHAWKWGSGVVSWKEDLKISKVTFMDILCDENGVGTLLVSTDNEFILFDPKNKREISRNAYETPQFKRFFSIGAGGSHSFATAASNKLCGIILKPEIMQRTIHHMTGMAITALRCHPIEDIIAAGDRNGMIVLYQGICSQENYVKTMYHWHFNPVSTITFTKSGKNFFSGGLERVLVKWTIGRPEHKDFLPRLSETINHVVMSPDNMKLALCFADNGIQIMNALLQQTAVIQNICCISDDKTDQNPYPIGLKVNPRTQNLVFNGRIGTIQFLSTYTRSLLYTLDITMKNINVVEPKFTIFNTRVTCLAINSYWMATVEYYDDYQYSTDTRLKFWAFDESKQSYKLSTNIENVHNGSVSAVEFSSTTLEKNLFCATAGSDNCVKLWALEDSDDPYKNKMVWMCVGKVQYKNLPVKSISFSQDGSILAAGFGNVLCSWNTDNLKLKCTLSAPAGLDGTLNKAVVIISSGNSKKLSKNDYLLKRKKILDQMLNLIEKKDTSILKIIKLNENSRILTKEMRKNLKSSELKDDQKKAIYKRVQQLNELSIVQKAELFTKLGIQCRTSDQMREKINKKLDNAKRFSSMMHENLKVRVENLYKSSKFLSKRKLSNYSSRKSKDIQLTAFTKVVSSEKEKKFEEDSDVLPVKTLAQIKEVEFCHGEYSHLVVVCTENRLVVWNLLTLRIQVSVNLCVQKVVLDQYTNLIAVFSEDNELFVFLPNVPIPLYHRKNLTKVHGAAWIPRRYPKSSSLNVDWQAISQLYFLNKKQEIIHLVADSDDESLGPVAYLNEAPNAFMPNTPFAAMLAKQINSSAVTQNLNRFSSKIGIPGKYNIKEIIGSSAHAMAPVSLLCNDFIKSLLITEDENVALKKATNTPSSEDVEELNDDNEKEEEEEEDQEMDAKILARKNAITILDKANTKRDVAKKVGKLQKYLEEKLDLNL